MTSSIVIHSLPHVICSHSEHHSLLQLDDYRPAFIKIKHVIQAFLKQIAEVFQLLRHAIYFYRDRKKIFLNPLKQANGWTYPVEALPWSQSTESEGLYLCIHGLRGTPYCWGSYLKKLKKKHPHAHVVAPYIAEQGNCTLETAGDPLVELVRHYIAKFPGKPIHLFGTSNGGRLASYLEINLSPQELAESQLHVASIVGVHHGTKLVDLLSKNHLLPLARLHPSVAEDFKWQSQTSMSLLERWKAKQITWRQHQIPVYHFFATALEDEKTLAPAGSLPILSSDRQGCAYQVYAGETHQTVVPAARIDIFKWIAASHRR